MYPDYDELFWDEESCSIGDTETIYLNNDKEVKINIQGLSEWLSKYVDEILIPCETNKISIEDLNKTYDWKSFLKEGIRLANEVRKILPENIELHFKTPIEYEQNEFQNDIRIIFHY